MAELSNLAVELYDYDRIGRDDFLGECQVELSHAINAPHTVCDFQAVSLSTQGSLTFRATFMPSRPQIRGGDGQELGEDAPDMLDGTITDTSRT